MGILCVTNFLYLFLLSVKVFIWLHTSNANAQELSLPSCPVSPRFYLPVPAKSVPGELPSYFLWLPDFLSEIS